jgi:hypothetical protein
MSIEFLRCILLHVDRNLRQELREHLIERHGRLSTVRMGADPKPVGQGLILLPLGARTVDFSPREFRTGGRRREVVRGTHRRKRSPAVMTTVRASEES